MLRQLLLVFANGDLVIKGDKHSMISEPSRKLLFKDIAGFLVGGVFFIE